MTTNRMGLTPEQSANSFTDDDLRSMITGNNPQSNAWRELLAYREASCDPVAWQYNWHNEGWRQCKNKREYDEIIRNGNPNFEVRPLYAAPPLQAVTVPDGWIKCSEQMPEVETPVLAGLFNCDNKFDYACYAMTEFDNEWVWVRCDDFGREDWWADRDFEITHWQPLPTPPQC